jgi:hypothetical protein
MLDERLQMQRCGVRAQQRCVGTEPQPQRLVPLAFAQATATHTCGYFNARRNERIEDFEVRRRRWE